MLQLHWGVRGRLSLHGCVPSPRTKPTVKDVTFVTSPLPLHPHSNHQTTVTQTLKLSNKIKPNLQIKPNLLLSITKAKKSQP